MGYHASILADSITEAGCRLTTFLVTFPRFILAEVNTHRMLSRNSASSRAIPVKRRVEGVRADPFIPASFGKNRAGMQAETALEAEEAETARQIWVDAMNHAIAFAGELAEKGVHKQLANRLLEPFSWHTAVISGTEWENFFAQRCHLATQPEFQLLARMMRALQEGYTPRTTYPDEWHLPFITPEELDGGRFDWSGKLRHISAARCARTSYGFDGSTTPNTEDDLRLVHDKLIPGGHLSPLEHPATPAPSSQFIGNFRGWKQLRKFTANEDNFALLGVT